MGQGQGQESISGEEGLGAEPGLPYGTALSADGSSLGKARLMSIEALMGGSWKGYSARRWEDLAQSMGVDPMALANQYVFALQRMPSRAYVPRDVAIEVTPLSHWLGKGCCSDRPSPVSHAMPPGFKRLGSPEGSGGDCCEWLPPEGSSPQEAAAAMLAAGFHWRLDFQKFIDSAAVGGGLDLMRPILEARQVARASHAAPDSPGGRRRAGL